MDVKYDYLINEKTVLFYGVYNENGETYTLVIDGEDRFLVAMSPIELIDSSLICYGSNFRGALKSSRQLLGKDRKKYPIKIDTSLDIWLFPTKSYKKINCVWFALNHAKHTHPLGVKFTKVFLSFGHTFEIEMKESAFREKRNDTKILKDMITDNAKKSANHSVEPIKGFMIVERNGEYKCKMKEKK